MAEFHQNELNKFCRVCGKLMFMLVSHTLKSLLKNWGLLCKDDPKIHSTSLCHNCYCTLMKIKNAIKDGRQYTSSPKVFTWKVHSTNCPICDHFQNAYSGGRRKKQKHPGHPASISTRAANNHIHSIAPSSFFP